MVTGVLTLVFAWITVKEFVYVVWWNEGVPIAVFFYALPTAIFGFATFVMSGIVDRLTEPHDENPYAIESDPQSHDDSDHTT